MTSFMRVFAGELSGTTLQTGESQKQSPQIFISPSGACGSYLLVAGALTRTEKLPGEYIRAWVSDPTGTFNLTISRQDKDLCEFLEQADPPVFVLATGELHSPRRNKKEVEIRPLCIRTIDRLTRDSWIIRTADQTMSRLETMELATREGTGSANIRKAINHYHMDALQIRSLVVMVEQALTKVDPVPGGKIRLPDPREILLELIKVHSGPKGVTISELLPLASGKGIREEQVIQIIRHLIEEDECYQPAAGAVKLL